MPATGEDFEDLNPIGTIGLRVGGKFLIRMEAKDGSMGFDFDGVYDVVNRHETIGYTMEDGRRMDIAYVDSKPMPNKTIHREEDAGEDAQRLSF